MARRMEAERRKQAYLDFALSAGVALARLRHDAVDEMPIAIKYMITNSLRSLMRLVMRCVKLTLES